MIVIAGPNGSGKTSVTSKILHHEWLEDSEYINPDNVARDIFGDWNDQQAILKAANLFRMSNGEVVKSYTADVPDWAEIILSK